MSAEIPVCHGVTLEQYAGLTAALADDFPLGAALALEGLDGAAWKRAGREPGRRGSPVGGSMDHSSWSSSGYASSRRTGWTARWHRSPTTSPPG